MLNKTKTITVSALLLLVVYGIGLATEKPTIFPIPLSVDMRGENTFLDKNTVIVVPKEKNEPDNFITELIQAELGDKYGVPINVLYSDKLPNDKKYILVGSLDDPVVKKYCSDNLLTDKVNELGDEGYVLIVDEKGVVVAAKTDKGALYGFQSFRQLLKKDNNKIVLPQVKIEDKPLMQVRAIKLYVPGRDNIPFFKRFIRDFMAKYKFNTILLELNGNMRLESHPEINTGTIKLANELNYSRRNRPYGPHGEYTNSSHQDVADGKILEKYEVADLVNYIRSFNIKVIPEIPSLTHSYYLLANHKDLAENKTYEYPDTYCPLHPEIYKIYFDVLNEYIEVIHPDIIHVGHDEWRMEMNKCDLSKGKDYGKLFADDLNKIHDFLKKKGIRTAIWGDHLFEAVRGKGFRVWKTKTGYEYKIPGALTPEQVEKLIPKDILIFNWFWSESKGGINTDRVVSETGFEQVYGNMLPTISKWDERVKIKGVLGGAPSSWAATTEFNFGKDLLYDFLGCANMLWSSHYQTPEQIAFITQDLMPTIKEDMSGKVLPSDYGLTVTPIDMTDCYNSTLKSGIDSIDVDHLATGKITKGNKVFNISDSDKKGLAVTTGDSENINNDKSIKIGRDVSSIIFLHAVAKETYNKRSYSIIYDFDDTSALLGWYEVVYDDGFVETIPIRYGVNILDWQTIQRIENKSKGKSKYAQNKYAYEAEIVPCSNDNKNPISFFAFEWRNPRFGKKIKEVRLKTVNKSKEENSVILLAVSVTGKKEYKKDQKSLNMNKDVE